MVPFISKKKKKERKLVYAKEKKLHNVHPVKTKTVVVSSLRKKRTLFYGQQLFLHISK